MERQLNEVEIQLTEQSKKQVVKYRKLSLYKYYLSNSNFINKQLDNMLNTSTFQYQSLEHLPFFPHFFTSQPKAQFYLILVLPYLIFLLSEMLNYNMNNTIINPQTSLKTFVFEREDTQQSVIVEQQLDLQPPIINLSYLLSLYCPLAQNKVSIYDPNISRFVLLSKIGSENGYIPKAFLEPSFILIRYIGKVEYAGQSDSVDSNLENQNRNDKKDNRSKERSIAEVIELVKKWRDLHMHGHKALKRRLNLQDAAKIVGISKKSLDDYYCQLRLGQLYNFNFYDNLNQKMGVLRSYVKNYRPERENKRRQNQKHPKNLRIIDQFDLQTKKLREIQFRMEQKEEEALPNPVMGRMQSQREDNRMVQQPSNPFEEASESSPIYKELFSLQNEFFKGFDLALDNEGDPYFDVDRDFRKKDFILDSDSFLLFD